MLRFCSICGQPLTKVDKYKPSTYCSTDCSDFNKFKTALEKSIIQIKPTKDARKILRGDLFRLSNLIGICTNTFEDGEI